MATKAAKSAKTTRFVQILRRTSLLVSSALIRSGVTGAHVSMFFNRPAAILTSNAVRMVFTLLRFFDAREIVV